MNTQMKSERVTKTISTRVTQSLFDRIETALTATKTDLADIVREGVARIATEFERNGSIRFGDTTIVTALKRRVARKTGKISRRKVA